MSKIIAVIAGVIVILATLFVNVVFSGTSDDTDLNFSNIDALAEEENSQVVQCIESGVICIGINKDNLMGRHPGLQLNPELWGD